MSTPQPPHLSAALLWPRYLLSAWPWRSAAYFLTTLPVAAPVSLLLLLPGLPWLAAAGRVRQGQVPTVAMGVLMLVGAAVVAALGPLVAIPLATAERRRLGIVDRRPLPSGHHPLSTDVFGWLRRRYSEAATWRELAYALFLAVVVPIGYAAIFLAVFLDLVVLTSPLLAAAGVREFTIGVAKVSTVAQALPYALLGLLVLVLLPYLVGLTVVTHVAIARALLGDAGATRFREVSRSRARLADAFEAERRRIERDLHDGAQHRLTSLTLQLGMARLDVPEGSPAAAALAKAHEQAKELMIVLRDLIHGIRPQTLVDLGLTAALRDLAARSPIPVMVGVANSVSERLPEFVESTAHFVALEALANVAKHSGATRAEVTASVRGDLLVLEIRDDGRGGADPTRGSGLTGLADRVAAVDGRLLLSSPGGGPTLVRVELPCKR